jgi:uncharacterized protein with von Willebrand factor type A (vWA) domain
MILHELLHMEERSLRSLADPSRQHGGRLFDEARNMARRRAMGEREGYEANRERRRIEESLASGDLMLDQVDEGDLRGALERYVEARLLEVSDGKIRITPQGSRRLARFILRRVLAAVSIATPGYNATEETGFGVAEASSVRPWEHGDEFWKIDAESSLLAGLARTGRDRGTIRFGGEDLWVRDTLRESRMVNGLIIDESGSMSGPKARAALDVALALAGLMERNRNDILRLFLFSTSVREMRHWQVTNARFAGGSTDIGAALAGFRKAVRSVPADKQVYLVTDSEPNTEQGQFVGFGRASSGVLREADLYRRDGITLNIVMLDDTPHLRDFASFLARRNLGRVFFSSPESLGRTIIENYLRGKRTGAGRQAS